MALYKKSSGTSGAWAKASDIPTGTRLRLVSECQPMQGEFGEQDVAKARFEGFAEPLNVRINKPTINALIEAFGEDSRQWMGQTLRTHIEPMNVGGRRVRAMYLLPEGYEVGEDEGGYVVIRRIGSATPGAATPAAATGAAGVATPARDPLAEEFDAPLPASDYPEEELDPADIPF